MTAVQVFENVNFGRIRTIEESGNVLFCGSDVAKALGYSNVSDSLAKHCKSDGVVFCEVIDKLGRTQKAKFISEGNLYRLITHSKLPAAEQFESWVFDEVLPTIHRTGKYTNQTTQTTCCTYNNRPVATIRQIAEHVGISVPSAQNCFAWNRKAFTYGTEYEILSGCTMEQFKSQNAGYGNINRLTIFTPKGAHRMLELCKRRKTVEAPVAEPKQPELSIPEFSIDETERNIRCFLDTANNLSIFLNQAKTPEDKRCIARTMRFNFAFLMMEAETICKADNK